MVFFVKKIIKKRKKVINSLYVADTHTFNLKGEQVVSLTDLRDYAQDFSIKEASAFVNSQKDNKDYIIVESLNPEEEDFDEEEYEDE